jgi:hypothetical protein
MSGADALNTKASMKEREAWQHVVGFLYTALFPCCPSEVVTKLLARSEDQWQDAAGE